MEDEISLRAYLHSLRFYVFAVLIIFLVSGVIGYFGYFNELFNVALSWIEELSKNMKSISGSYPAWVSFLLFFFVIFLNNSLTCFLDILLGPFAGIFPIFSAFVNGGIIGWFAQRQGLYILIAIIPHGIFEIPAFLLSTAIGLKLGRELFRHSNERHLLLELKRGLRVYFILILPLLLAAAIIESLLITLLPLLISN